MLRSDWLMIGVLGIVFGPAILAMADEWSRLDYYNHCYFIPFVAIWAATSKRRLLESLPAAPDRRGLLVLGVALGIDLVGMAASLLWLQGLSVVLATAGGLLAVRGMAWVRALAFPLGFLIFMVPLPAPVLAPVITGLQVYVSTAAVSILRGMGIAIFQEGNVLQLPDGESLFVAEACSGITSIITFLPLGVILAYWTESSWVRRTVLVASVVPVAMLGNLIRVLTVVLARVHGVEAAHYETIHDAAGLLVYILGCLVLVGIGRLMRLMAPPESSPRRPQSDARRQVAERGGISSGS